MPKLETQMHSAPVDSIRSRENLANFMPDGYENLDEIDAFCRKMIAGGRLIVNDDRAVLDAMAQIKNPGIPMREYRGLSNRIHSIMARFTFNTLAEHYPGKPVKVAISERAGLAAFPAFYRIFNDSEFGFAPQTRDEEDPNHTITIGNKLGSFAGMHAVVMDPMLATGGSIESLIDEVVSRGAIGVTTVTTFSSPQGIIRLAKNFYVGEIITPPLEAGVNTQGFIVGGHEPFPMLGDSGDRSFGKVD